MVTKTLIPTILICLSLQQQVIDITEISEGYDWLFNQEKFCRDRRVAITTDKPVYKIGETMYITLYFYNVYNKQPVNKCKQNIYSNLVIQDSDDKYLLSVERDSKKDDEIQDYSSVSLQQKISEDKFKGGVYKLIYNNQPKDEIKFFVLQFNNRRAGVVSNWNIETVKPGDILQGQVVLKSFTREQQFQNVVAQYSFLDANGNILQQEQNLLIFNNTLNLQYQVPQNIGGLLVLDIVFDADGIRVPYKKEFQEAQFDDIQIEFTLANSKVAINAPNTFYFRAFKGEDKIFTTQIRNARIFKKILNLNQIVEENVSTNDEGMGKFTFYVSDQDIAKGTVFNLQVQFSDFDIRNFIILDTNQIQTSKISLQMQERIYNMQDNIQFTLSNIQNNTKYNVVIQDKTKIYYEDILTFNGMNQVDYNINIKQINIPNGGAYTIQIYSQVSKEDKQQQVKKEDDEYIKQEEQQQRQNQLERGVAQDKLRIYPIRPPTKIILFLGQLDQETLIFIKPQYLLDTEIQFNKESYGPGEVVNFTLNNIQNCQYCPPNSSNTRAIIEVVDASAFVEVDQSSTSSSLFTKIFLEKEIYNEKNEFRNNSKYIDYLFNSQERNDANQQEKNLRLELLLGNQKWRQLFLGLDNLEKYKRNKWDKQYEKYRDNFDYFLPDNNGGIFPVMQFEQPVLMRAVRAQPMMFAANRVLAKGNAQNDIVIQEEAAIDFMDGVVFDDAQGGMQNENIQDNQQTQDQQKDNEQQQIEKILKKDNIYYQSSQQFDQNNQIQGEFKLPNEVQTFRMRVLLYDQEGNYGVVYKQITSKKDYNVYAEEPTFILSNEDFNIKLVVENSTTQPETISFTKPFVFNVMVPPNGNQTYQILLNKNNLPFNVQAVNSRNENVADFTINPAIIKSGITINKGKSDYLSIKRGDNSSLSYEGIIPQDLISGDTVMKVCYNNPGVGLILDAIEKMNRIPTGCFEQASSTNFPIVLALQIVLSLPKTPRTDQLKNKLLENLRKGIKLLLTYETDDGGFEWFGKSPGHSTLTAYGLWQFREISKLNIEENLFDRNLLQRLKNFLQNNNNGSGGWTITNGLDSLGNPPQDISDKYIAYVLSVEFAEIRELFDEQFKMMDQELQRFKKGENIESYQLVLLGLYAKNKNDIETAKQILKELLKRQNKSEGYIEKSETSITRSSGGSLKVETTSLTIILFIELKDQNVKSLQKMIEFLTKNLNNGYFGSTQATILSLLAFKKYLNEFTSNSQQDIVLNISINGQFISQLRANGSDLLNQNSCSDISFEFREVEARGQKFQVQVQPNSNYLTNNNNRYLISIEHSYQQVLPDSVKDSPLQATITKNEAQNTRIYEITLQNTVDKEQGMTLIEFNKPSCMDINISELENLTLQGEADYFELLDNNSKIVFYFKGLRPNQRKNFRFSMYNRYALNQCEERTHMIYLYYDKEGSILYKRADQFIKF